MADWKNNPMVGVAAGIILALSLAAIFLLSRPKSFTPATGGLETPASTPMVNKTK